MFRSSWGVGNCAIVSFGFLAQSLQQATVVTGCYKRLNNQALALKSLGCSIDIEDACFFLISVDLMDHAVEEFPGHHIVKSTDDDIKFSIKLILHFLDLVAVGDDLDSRASSHHKLSHNFCLHFPNVLMPKQKLSIQVGQVDGIHINQMNISDAGNSQILNNLTAKATSTNNQNLIFWQVFKECLIESFLSFLIEGGGVFEIGLQVVEDLDQWKVTYWSGYLLWVGSMNLQKIQLSIQPQNI